MKTIKRLVMLAVLLVVLLVGGVVFLYLRIDSLAAAAVEKGSEQAMGVDSSVGGVSVSLLGGRIGMTEYVVGNPAGFETPFLLSNDDLKVEVETGSLFSDEVVIPAIELTGLKVNIEQKGGTTNIQKVTDHLKSQGGDEPASDEPGKKYRVGRIVIRNLEANVQVLPVGGQATSVKVPIPELVFENVTKDNANGVVLSQLMEQLFPAILAAIVDKAGDLGDMIPAALLNDLKGNVSEMAEGLGAEATKLIEEMGGDVGKGAGEAVQEGINKATEGLRGLLGGEK